MHRRRRSPLVTLPLIGIALIALGMTRVAFAASSVRAETAAPRASKTIVRMIERATQRGIRRRSIVMRSALRPAAGTQSSSVAAADTETDSTLERERKEIFRLVNEERVARGLAPYERNQTLETSAQEYAEHLRAEKCFSHAECGSTLKERMHASGYFQRDGRSFYYGENIARGQDSAHEVMEDWMNSPSHRDAILSERFTEIGIGISEKYRVQHFGAVR